MYFGSRFIHVQLSTSVSSMREGLGFGLA